MAAPIGLKDAAAAGFDGRTVVFCDEARAGAGDRAPVEAMRQADGGPAWGILIGPEGGFSLEERALLTQTPGVVPISLGPRILRADTAVFAALTLWQAVLGDWRGA